METSFAGAETRRSVKMGDTECVQIRHQLFRVPEAKVEVELNAISGAGNGHGSGNPHSQLLPQGSKALIPFRHVAPRSTRLISIRRVLEHGVVTILNFP